MKKQSGFVSILVTMILMVLTSLIVLSFAFLSRQNQTRNLNSQLSTQAFYAAESGVNVAAAKLRAGGQEDIKDCSGTSALGQQQIGADDTVRFTCVLIDQSPTLLKFEPISTEKSTVIRVRAPGASTMLVSWQSASTATHIFMPGGTFALPQQNSPMAQDGGTGILRTSVIPTNAIGGGGDQSGSLISASRNYFLYPNRNFGSTPGSIAASAPDGSFGLGNCSLVASQTLPRDCNTRIDLATSDFYLRLKAVYSPVNVTIQLLNSADQPQPINGAQAVIDATGKAQNVVRRIQVYMPLASSYIFPEFGLETSDSICKRFAVYPGGAAVIDPPSYLYSGTNPNNKSADNEACKLPGTP